MLYLVVQQDAPPAPYYEFNPFLQEEADYPQQEPYDVYEESLRQGTTYACSVQWLFVKQLENSMTWFEADIIID